jgi:hypothetical protein
MTDPIIGRRLFTDGTKRAVYRAGDGRQYMLDDRGLPVFGVWVLAEREEGAPAPCVMGQAHAGRSRTWRRLMRGRAFSIQ